MNANLFFMGADVFSLIVFLIIFLFSVVLHEVSHGLMAYHLGDSTAKDRKRLTLNPLVHIDPVGSILVPGLLILSGAGMVFGWAKPVPVDFSRLRDRKYGATKVALAGPGANLIIALVFGFLARLILNFWGGIAFFNNLTVIFEIIVWVNLLLAIFNLLPIPPLDGSHILATFLPYSWQRVERIWGRYGFFLLLIFIFFFFDWLIPVIQFFFKLIVGHYFY